MTTAVTRQADSPGEQFLTPAAALYTSLNLETQRDRAIAIRMGSHDSLDEVIGQVIMVEHVMAHTVDLVSEATGEITTNWRVILIGPEGAPVYQCVSQGVRDSIGVLSAFMGKPPWVGGLLLKVEQVKTRRGFRTFNLVPVAG